MGKNKASNNNDLDKADNSQNLGDTKRISKGFNKKNASTPK